MVLKSQLGNVTQFYRNDFQEWIQICITDILPNVHLIFFFFTVFTFALKKWRPWSQGQASQVRNLDNKIYQSDI